MKQKGFSAIFILIGLLMVSGIIGAGYYVSTPNQEKSSATKSGSSLSKGQPPPEVDEKLDVGQKRIVVFPGKTNITLPSGALITFLYPIVPDFMWDSNILNDNSLPISKKLVTFHNNYKYDITNEGCKTEGVVSDVPETRVLECTLNIITTMEQAPVIKFADYKKEFLITELGTPIKGLQSLPGEPVLFLSAYPIRVQKNDLGAMYAPTGVWDIYILTNYGYQTVKFTPEEIWDKQSKTINLGPQEVTISIDGLSCKNLRDAGPECPYFTEVAFSVMLHNSNDEPATPIKILEYQ